VRLLVIGSGGREHALVKGLLRDSGVTDVHAAPGNAGMAADATVHAVDIRDGDAVGHLAKTLAADLVVIGPEEPLVRGVADAVRDRGIDCFGPGAEAARLEGSKAFAKEVMAAAGVPTAMAHVCDTAEEAAAALDAFGPPYVVKNDGLAAGKGVVVTDDREAALAHAAACPRVVIEEYLDGPEVSVFCLTDGEVVMPLLPAQDYKRAYDDDQGPNTGGMGAYAPLDWAPPALAGQVVERIAQPVIDELRHRGTPFAGMLYVGLALTGRGPRVLEFNARFGDPETQVVLALLTSPLGSLLRAAATGALRDHVPPHWAGGAAITVVLAAKGYPTKPRRGDLIRGWKKAAAVDGVEIIHAGTTLDEKRKLRSSGGRVLSVTATGSTLENARGRAYAAIEHISLAGSFYRRDIGLKAVEHRIKVPSLAVG
jgi:phosphoribosylamine---glycine ligase